MRLIPAALILSLASVPALAAAPKNAIVVPIKTSTGEDAGTATFTPSKKGVHLKLELKNLPVGEHGVHVHASPHCDPPDFKTAGPHFNPTNKQHGFQNPMGHHAGDTPHNVSIGEGHVGQASFTLDAISLDPSAPNSILANGGTSIIVHAMADDMKTDPAGNSGNRIACGVITAPTP
jgi:Cu-Zn family superoxide dismutase